MPDSELGMVSTVVDKADGVLILMEHSIQQGHKEQWWGWGRGWVLPKSFPLSRKRPTKGCRR